MRGGQLLAGLSHQCLLSVQELLLAVFQAHRSLWVSLACCSLAQSLVAGDSPCHTWGSRPMALGRLLLLPVAGWLWPQCLLPSCCWLLGWFLGLVWSLLLLAAGWLWPQCLLPSCCWLQGWFLGLVHLLAVEGC